MRAENSFPIRSLPDGHGMKHFGLNSQGYKRKWTRNLASIACLLCFSHSLARRASALDLVGAAALQRFVERLISIGALAAAIADLDKLGARLFELALLDKTLAHIGTGEQVVGVG